MLTLLKPKRRSLLGIDISSTSVKVLELSGPIEQPCVNGYGTETLPLNAVEGNTIKDVDAVANTIKKIMLRAQLTTKNAVLAVPDSAVISKVIQMNDGLSDNEMEELVIMEADKYIPYSIDEINIDFEVIGHSVKNPSLLDVLIVASRTENVTSRVEVAKRAGLETKAIDVESYAMERAAQFLTKGLPAQGQDKIIALIDIGGLYSHLYVMHGMKIIFTREEEFGGKQLIDGISYHYGVSTLEAIQMKDSDNMPADYEEAVLLPFMEMLQIQLKRALQFFYSTSHYNYIDHMMLAGGVSKLPGLAVKVQESTNIPTSIANPFNQINLSRSMDRQKITEDAPSLLVACGLALRRVK